MGINIFDKMFVKYIYAQRINRARAGAA